MTRRAYSTRQRELVLALMAAHDDAYLTVDEACELLGRGGEAVGRTTVYRTLERLAADGRVVKVSGNRGEAAQYRALGVSAGTIGESARADHGQLRCERCGRAFPLDCEMLGAFSAHVLEHHGFSIDQRRTVIYGLCAACRAEAAGDAAHV